MKDKRQQQLKLYLETNGKMTYAELSEKFPYVSEMTLRRDLRELQKEGVALIVKGGAVWLGELSQQNFGEVLSRANRFIFEKHSIAEKTVRLISDANVCYIDAGSTTTFFAKEFPDKNITVYTNGITIIGELIKKPNVKLISVGGEISKSNQATFGRQAENFISGINFDVAVMATSAYSFKNGFSCKERADAELKSFALTHAKKKIMLLDSSKLETTLEYTFAKIENINYLVVDEHFPQDLRHEFIRRGVKVI